MEHLGHLRVGLEPVGDGERVAVVPLHAHRQGLDPPHRQEAVKGGLRRAHRVLEHPDLGGKGLIVGDRGTGDHIGVAVDVLGGGVHHHVDPQLQRALVEGREEGVVAEGDNPLGLGDLGDSGEVQQVHQGVGRSLGPDSLGLGADRGA